MQTVQFPGTYQQLMPYLIVERAARFISFMEEVFNAQVRIKHMRDDNIIQHAELMIGNCVLMVADAIPDYPAYSNGFFIYVADADATYALALEKGAKAVMAPADKDYGRSCGITDTWGNTWWVTTHVG